MDENLVYGHTLRFIATSVTFSITLFSVGKNYSSTSFLTSSQAFGSPPLRNLQWVFGASQMLRHKVDVCNFILNGILLDDVDIFF